MNAVTHRYPEHVGEVSDRWSAALEAEGFDGALVHAGSQIVSFRDDYHYPFRPNPLFQAWLPLAGVHDSVLVVRPGQRPVLWYYQPDDYWHLPPSDPETWWAEQFDLRLARSPEEWKQSLNGGRMAMLGDTPELDPVSDAESRNPAALVTRLELARTRKTEYEIECMAEAGRIAARAHRAAERTFRDGGSEFEIHMAYLDAAQHTDAQLPYGNIVALDDHGAVLHYQYQRRDRVDARSFLIDAGATCQGYCSDITRTYARQPGEFQELIDRMDAMQQRLVDAARPGADYKDIHLRAHSDIAGILAEAGIITVSAETAVESGLSAVFYPHGLGHFIGLQTHDVAGLIDDDGNPIDRPEGHPFLRLTRVLETGNALTVEPGLYFIDTLQNQWKANGEASMINWETVERLAPYGGIRIEDDVVVTDTEPLNLTRPAFAALD